MAKILIIDDDEYINDMLCEALQNDGYGILRAYSGTEALMLLSKDKPSLILLDLMLPGLSGEELLPKISGIPVIVVSAKAAVSDKVRLLLGGAVDYVTKPFDIRELLARISVALRGSVSVVDKGYIEYEELRLDKSTHTAYTNSSEIRLTRTEYAILKLLMQNNEQVVAKLTILEEISSDTPDCTEDSLKIHIHNLKKKLKTATGKEYITAVWGIGYMLSAKN